MKLRRIIHRVQPIRHIIERSRRHKEMRKREIAFAKFLKQEKQKHRTAKGD